MPKKALKPKREKESGFVRVTISLPRALEDFILGQLRDPINRGSMSTYVSRLILDDKTRCA